MTKKILTASLLCIMALSAADEKSNKKNENWVSLFNGKDLTGWNMKFLGHDAGENHKNTFRVEDGLLKVSYDDWDKWDGSFGHLFYKSEFSHYKLRVEYRFVGEQAAGGPGWAKRNNGIMIHGQPIDEMTKDQDFPISIEVQLLGGLSNGNERSTMNLCTPGTQVVFNDKVEKRHCTNSTSKTCDGDQWVSVEVEVDGGKTVTHKVEGKEVLTYKMPQLDDGTVLTQGTISLQAESHPTEFRKIEILNLQKKDETP